MASLGWIKDNQVKPVNMVNKSSYSTPETEIIEVRFDGIIMNPSFNNDDNTQTIFDDGEDVLE